MKYSKEFHIWCDESDKDGQYYTNFYGGILIQSSDVENVLYMMNIKVEELGIEEEIKWQKVNAYTFEKYILLIDFIFELLAKDLIKIRIFFKSKQFMSQGLTREQEKAEYPILYYQFIKHSFGLQYANIGTGKDVHVKLFLDDIPLKGAEKDIFLDYIFKLNNDKDLKASNIKIRRSDISEVDSKKHLPLQMMDLILGAMCFRLNDKHKEKKEGTNRRGKRTIIKEKLYKHINKKLRELRPNFNIGESTGFTNHMERWTHPYRHWSFKSTGYIRNFDFSKGSKRKE